MQTVVETKYYSKRAEKLLTEFERNKVIDIIAFDPEKGDVIRGTGGARKIRFAVDDKGKSGGFRVIYYYHNENFPILLLTLFKKNEKPNLSKTELKEIEQFITELKKKIRNKMI